MFNMCVYMYIQYISISIDITSTYILYICTRVCMRTYKEIANPLGPLVTSQPRMATHRRTV